MRRILPIKLLLLMLLIFCFVAGGWALLLQQDERSATVMTNRGDYVRLHILANSDSIKDQQLKLKVRDAVIAYLTPFVKDVSDAGEANTIIANHQANIIMVANAVVSENGANYPVAVQMGTFEFPVRSYGSLVLPAGEYQAVRILLGQAAGQNWWCVLFPPLCFIDGANTALAPVSEAAATEQQGNRTLQIKWKIAELFK